MNLSGILGNTTSLVALSEFTPIIMDAVKVIPTEEFSRKHSVCPVSLVKPNFQTGDNKFPSRNKTYTPKDIVEVEDSPCPLQKIIHARKIRLNGKIRDNIWSDSKPKQQIRINGWQNMPYQMVTFT
ncbi:hypothetical protein O181_041920 [Austropuccinia psidii MF-1]|uniref:Uncharacterized protein n=1 Tax=Austropuccinia psidii MF-1 TaxID=1389203 RepID=A0A9Q3DJM1_9BASI|nr:hypothetical protein [Austropuccinia psidii MF-1]